MVFISMTTLDPLFSPLVRFLHILTNVNPFRRVTPNWKVVNCQTRHCVIGDVRACACMRVISAAMFTKKNWQFCLPSPSVQP